ncbi:unnamed protein product [Prunus brigantina]
MILCGALQVFFLIVWDSTHQCIHWLASYISRRFIQFIEDLAVRYSDDLLVISAGQHLRSLRHGICKSFSEDVPFIFKGLTLPLHGLQFAWRLAISCWRSSVVYVRCAHLRICR